MTKENSNQEIKSWWCYMIKQTGLPLTYDRETQENVTTFEEPLLLQDGTLESGRYSTLQNAIQGFLNDELDESTQAKIEYDEDDENKFKLTATQWTDTAGTPANELVINLWRKGKIQTLLLTKIEVRFKCVSEWQASVQDYAQVMNCFSKRILTE